MRGWPFARNDGTFRLSARPSMRARDERVGKRQADGREEIERYAEESGRGEESGHAEEAARSERRCAEARGWRVGGGVHAARARRASLLAREVGADDVLVRRPDGGEEPHDAVG